VKKLESLHLASEAKVLEISAAIKAQVTGGDTGLPNETVKRLVREARKLQADSKRQLRLLQRNCGISEAEICAIERALERERLPSGDAFWHDQILQSRATEDLDELAESGLAQLLANIDPDWLRREATKQYRLSSGFLTCALHLVSGIPVGTCPQVEGPQRFARMLLVCQDHLKNRADLDFFSAAMFVPEVAVLGNSLKEIPALGAEAQRKLDSLPFLTDDAVTSTIFELLVGAACVRRGLSVTMVPEDRAHKVPDFRVTGLGAIPGAIECKRRLGLTVYELDEARHVEALYQPLRTSLKERGFHCSVEVAFAVPVRAISARELAEPILENASFGRDQDTTPTRWGSFRIRRLPHFDTIPRTRLYSPDFISHVFGWHVLENEWDGIFCEVESPTAIMVNSYRMPLCLKWRSETEEAVTRRARGIRSLWTNAIKQIPPGEIGFVYIAYPEGGRPAIADARTQHILKTMEESWHHWFVRIPVTVINRLYPRPIHEGRPDLIESVLPGAAKGQEHWLTYLPWTVFTRQFEGRL